MNRRSHLYSASLGPTLRALALVFAAMAGALPVMAATQQAASERPNVVLILLDDVGFGATATFGGPVASPALDQLAAEGLRYNQFHTAGLCSPTRAALLSGRNHHRLGFGTVPEMAAELPGYNARWPRSAATVAEVLRQNGYHTSAFGKWHNTPTQDVSSAGPFDRWPTGMGFDDFYGFQGGETSQWEPVLYRGTTPVERTAAQQGKHLTEDLVDNAVQWVREHEANAPNRPYFLYFATGAVHAPHHVPADWIAAQKGRFDEGWDKLREKTFAHQKALGLVPTDAALSPRPAELPAWDSLSADEHSLLARQMEVFAAFLAHTDHEVGRLLSTIQATRQANNTLILYVVGDNGGSTEGGLFGTEQSLTTYMGLPAPDLGTRLSHLDELGSAQHSNNYAAAWAWALNTPFPWMKNVASHLGATRNPMVISWPNHIQERGGLRSQFHHVVDIMPTIYEAAGIPIPKQVNGTPQSRLDGISMGYTLADPNAPSRRTQQFFEIFGNRAIYSNGWLAGVRVGVPWDFNKTLASEGAWELYHLSDDYTQAHDLAGQYPNKLHQLQQLFDQEARRNQAYPLLPKTVSATQKALPSANAVTYSSTVFYAGMKVDKPAMPNFNQSHRITVELKKLETGAEGVLWAVGGRTGGATLYIQNGRLVYERNFAGKAPERLVSTQPLPAGGMALQLDVQKSGKTDHVQLLLNGQPITEPALFSYPILSSQESMDIGLDRFSPVSAHYAAPYAYTGHLVELRLAFPPY